MEIGLILATIVGGIAGMIQLYKWLHERKIRPRLDMKIEYRDGSSFNKGISPRAKPAPGQDYFVANETLHIFELSRTVILKVVNNSESTAYYPRLLTNSRSQFQPKFRSIDSINPIPPYSDLLIEGKLVDWEECLPRERTDVGNFPSKVAKEELDLIIEYQSLRKKKYFTRLVGDNTSLEYLRTLPKNTEFKPA